LASFSNQGPELDVVAPGVDVLSTFRVGTGLISFVVNGQTTYAGGALTGTKKGSVTGEYVFCGLGKREEIPASVAGKIALIKRGDLTFAEKTRNAKEAGAIAVVIFNRDDSAISWTLIVEEDPSTATYDWPVTVGIPLADGEALAAKGGGTITVAAQADDYGSLSGTSMATPHVAGAAAVLWAVAPNATAAEVAAALKATAHDLGAAGPDVVFGAGVIDVFEATKHLSPTAFNPIDPTNPPPGSRPTTGRRYVRRGGG
jgi:serine protease